MVLLGLLGLKALPPVSAPAADSAPVAVKRGHAPAVRVVKRFLAQAEAHRWPIARGYRAGPKRYGGRWPGIRRPAAQRC